MLHRTKVFHGGRTSRVALLLYDVLAATACAFIASFAFTQPALAYVDPSVMTYTIQALAGVAVALSAVAGVAFRRSRRAIMGLLHIDENAKKEHDAPFARIEPAEQNLGRSVSYFMGSASGETPSIPAEEKPQRSESKRSSNEGYLYRLILSIIVALFLGVTVFVMPPFEALGASSSSIVFELSDVWQLIVGASLAVVVCLALVLSVLRGSVFNGVLLLVFSFALCCYVQAMFLNLGLPSTDGRFIAWTTYKKITVASAAAWLVIMLLPWQMSKLNRKAVQVGAGAIAACLVIVQGVAAGSILASMSVQSHTEEGEVPANQYVMTDDDMFTVPSGKNVIFFVLDTYDTADMERLVASDPSLLQNLEGFTWFKDSVGSMGPTRFGVPYLLTGVYPRADESWKTFVEQRYLRSSYIADIYDEGYSIGIYTDSLGEFTLSDDQCRDLIYDKTVNIVAPPEEERPQVAPISTLAMMLKVSAYRDLLWMAKPFAYFTTDELNQAMAGIDPEAPAADNEERTANPYVMDDAGWYASLKDQGLSFEDREDEGAFRFIHLLGTHWPYLLDENGELGDQPTLDSQAEGSFRMVEYYLSQMKELGVYDDATIVITADHGYWFELEEGDDSPISSPLMLVKPAGANDVPVQESNAEIIAYDSLATVIDAIGGDREKYGPTIFEQGEWGRERFYANACTLFNTDYNVIEYRIDGNVLDPDSWSHSGVYWDPSDAPR